MSATLPAREFSRGIIILYSSSSKAVLKVSSKTSKLRLKKRKTKNRYDNFPQSFYTKAQKSFLKIARNKPNYFVLDSSLDNNDLEKKIFKIVSKYLKIK